MSCFRPRAWCFVGLTLLALSVTACSTKTEAPPKAKVPDMPAAAVPKWVKLFGKSPSDSPKLIDGLGLGSAEADVRKRAPELLAKTGLSSPEYGAASVRLLLHGDSRRVRAIKVSLPRDVLSHFVKLWGAPREASINGQEDGWFWFDEAKRIQVILRKDMKGAQLMYWHFNELAELFTLGDGKLDPTKPLSLLGRSEAAARGAYVRKMERKAQPGFVTWLHPLRFWTRPLSIRIGLENQRVESVSWKHDVTGDPTLEARIQKTLGRDWQNDTKTRDGSKNYTRNGLTLSLNKRPAGQTRPNEFVIDVVARRSDKSAPADPVP